MGGLIVAALAHQRRKRTERFFAKHIGHGAGHLFGDLTAAKSVSLRGLGRRQAFMISKKKPFGSPR